MKKRQGKRRLHKRRVRAERLRKRAAALMREHGAALVALLRMSPLLARVSVAEDPCRVLARNLADSQGDLALAERDSLRLRLVRRAESALAQELLDERTQRLGRATWGCYAVRAPASLPKGGGVLHFEHVIGAYADLCASPPPPAPAQAQPAAEATPERLEPARPFFPPQAAERRRGQP